MTDLDAEIVELAAYVPSGEATAPLREVAFRGNAWLPEELDTLRRMFAADAPLEEIVEAVGRPLQGLRSKLWELGLRRNSQRPWSDLEDAHLIRRYAEEPAAVIAQELGRAVCAIYARAGVLGLSEPGFLPWTPWEDAQLVAGYEAGVPVGQLAALIGRPLSGAQHRAGVLGLRHASMPPGWSDEEVARALDLAGEGVKYRAICQRLADEGFPPRTHLALKPVLWRMGYGRGWGRAWTVEEEELLRRAYRNGDSLTPLITRLGRGHSSLVWKARGLGLTGTHKNKNGFRQGPDWTEEEVAKLKAEYGKRRPREIAADLNRPVRAIYSRAFALGLKDPTRRRLDDREKQALRIAHAHELRLMDVARAMGRQLSGLNKLTMKMGLSFSDPRRQRVKRPDLTLDDIFALDTEQAA